jgi:hypothetical protein
VTSGVGVDLPEVLEAGETLTRFGRWNRAIGLWIDCHFYILLPMI